MGDLGSIRLAADGSDVGDKIQHVFVLMMENRSFDHIFGRYQGSDRPGQTLDNLHNSHWLDRALADKAGRRYRLGDARAKDNVSPDPPHEMEDVACQLNGKPLKRPPVGAPPLAINYGPGRRPCDGYVRAYLENPDIAAVAAHKKVDPRPVIASWDEAGAPVLTALAREYALCDRWFSSVPGPTWPNRLFVHAGHAGGLDFSPSGQDCAAKLFTEGYDLGEHIFDRLRDRAAIYTDELVPLAVSLKGINRFGPSTSPVRGMEHFEKDLRSGALAGVRYVFIEPNYGQALGTDVTNEYAGGNSQHAVASFKAGEAFIARVYNALRASALWQNSLLIITWDEHGGFFDHCPPPRSAALAPSRNATRRYSRHRFRFDALGVRVPALFISPYVRQGHIHHAVHDHSVIPNFIADWFTGRPLPQGRKPKPGGVAALSARAGLFDWSRDPSAPRLKRVSLSWSGWARLKLQRLAEALRRLAAAVTPSGPAGLGDPSRTVRTRALIAGLAAGKAAAEAAGSAQARAGAGQAAKAQLDALKTRAQHLDYIRRHATGKA